MPSVPSIPSIDLPFSALVIAILLASLLLAFVISAHLKEDKVNIPALLNSQQSPFYLQVWKRTELGGLLTLLALVLLLPAIATHISKAREAEEVKHILVNINITHFGKN